MHGFVCARSFVWVLLFVQFILSFTNNLIHLVPLLLREFRHLCSEIPVKISDVVNSQVQLGAAREHIDAGIVKDL